VRFRLLKTVVGTDRDIETEAGIAEGQPRWNIGHLLAMPAIQVSAAAFSDQMMTNLAVEEWIPGVGRLWDLVHPNRDNLSPFWGEEDRPVNFLVNSIGVACLITGLDKRIPGSVMTLLTKEQHSRTEKKPRKRPNDWPHHQLHDEGNEQSAALAPTHRRTFNCG
jgi:hypothetical protein